MGEARARRTGKKRAECAYNENTSNVTEGWNFLLNFCKWQEKKDRVYKTGEKINGYETRDRVERALEEYLQLE